MLMFAFAVIAFVSLSADEVSASVESDWVQANSTWLPRNAWSATGATMSPVFIGR